jgi:acylphosphatase
MPARRWVIRGVVQGVGFRHATQREGLRLGLSGWVRNRTDGAVEAVALGDAAQLDAMDAWVKRGPPAAHVAQVDATVLSGDDVAGLDPPVPDGFRQVATVG